MTQRPNIITIITHDTGRYIIDNPDAHAWMAKLQGALQQADDGVKLILDALEKSGNVCSPG